VYRLTQKDSSLQGAALAAAGIETVAGEYAEKIQVAGGVSLEEKYRRWKGWFDELLAKSVSNR
jgi:hypothetical protein